MLQIYASRVAAEIERLKQEEALARQARVRLEVRGPTEVVRVLDLPAHRVLFCARDAGDEIAVAFLAFDERLRLINGVIKPGYERLKADLPPSAECLVDSHKAGRWRAGRPRAYRPHNHRSSSRLQGSVTRE